MKDSEIHISTKTLIRFWLVIIALALTLGLCYLARSVIVLILVAFFLAIVLNRPVEFFARILPGHNRFLGTFISFLIFVVVIGGVLTLIVPIFFEQSINFAKTFPDTISSLQEGSQSATNFIKESGLEETYNSALEDISTQFTTVAAQMGSWSVDFLANLLNWLGNAFIVLILAFFMLLEGPKWIDMFWKNVYKNKKKMRKHQAVAEKMYDIVADFATGQLIIATICGALAGIGVFIFSMCFGIPSTLILPVSAVIFVTAFIPLFGPYIGIGISVLLVLLYNPIAALILLIYLALYQGILYTIFSPKIQSRKMKISALAILLAIVVGLQVGGVFGAIVSIPVAGCIIVLFREIVKNRHEIADAK
ncbi:MAG: AI-2E family transporter [Candidatus Nomurabacteria bacterium]|jgi:predicted PurR-regulated permease PerM|nr:AI-2E family transporter [Candidatus Nomurabacteria bacterium]